MFLQIVRDLDGFEGDEAGFRSWVFTIAHRRSIDALRASTRRPVADTSDTQLEAALPPVTTEPAAMERIGTDEVLALLDRLTDDQREVLVLRLVAGLRASEIAAVTGRPRDAVKALQKRGIHRLRTLLAAPEAAASDPSSPDDGDER